MILHSGKGSTGTLACAGFTVASERKIAQTRVPVLLVPRHNQAVVTNDSFRAGVIHFIS
jgi:hypothetical protein